MQISNLKITNFRGIKSANLYFSSNVVLIGDNNVGKSTILESLDLVLGPDRLYRSPVIDEHDFYNGEYIDSENYKVEIEATITNLSDSQQAKFFDHIEWWNIETRSLYTDSAKNLDKTASEPALRVTFVGTYDPEEDNFQGETFFTSTIVDGLDPIKFGKKDKQQCGFLYLRSLRTGSRALSLESGSLLDIILRLKEVRPKMWEKTIKQLHSLEVATSPDLGISEILESIEKAIRSFVPKEWGMSPRLKVSSLTRDHLRKVITAFVATGSGEHSAPYYRQGTGTLNLLVLAMLSIIAKDKGNVIFAMEEPETAISPYAQKRIIHEVKKLSTQSIFTSHSPYVIEEFEIDETLVLNRENGILTQNIIELPAALKYKRYKSEFRTKFCEGLLSRRVFITEGRTEFDAFPTVARYLGDINPEDYSSFEALGICTIDAQSESNLPGLAELMKSLGKDVFIACDKQTKDAAIVLVQHCNELFMHEEKGFEKFVIENSDLKAISRFVKTLGLPEGDDSDKDKLFKYFKKKKGDAAITDFLLQCTEHEMPKWIKQICKNLNAIYSPKMDLVEDAESLTNV